MNGLYTVKALIDYLHQHYSLDDYVLINGCLNGRAVIKDVVTDYGSKDIQLRDHQINQILSLLPSHIDLDAGVCTNDALEMYLDDNFAREISTIAAPN